MGYAPKPKWWEKSLKLPHLLVRSFALFSLLAGAADLYDLFLGTTDRDSAIITEKTHTTGRAASWYIRARGRFHYNEGVPPRFWRLCETGDTLELSLTPLFKEWRSVTLVRTGAVIAESKGSDILAMSLFGLAFLTVAAASIFIPGVLLRKPFYWVSASVIDLVAILLLAKYAAVLAGVFEKM